MSYFGTRRKLVTFSVASRLMPDDSIVTSNKVGVLRYLLENRGKFNTSVFSKSMSDYLVEASNNSIYRKYERAYNYANSGNYHYGLPTSREVDIEGTDVPQTVKDYIESVVGQTVTLKYAFIGDPNYSHFIWKILIDDYGYDPTTNELTTLSTSEGFPCYLSTGNLVYGSTTKDGYETEEPLIDYGFSLESGECLTRSQDLNRAKTLHDEDAGSEDAYVNIEYKYIEIIPDTTPPNETTVNTLTTTQIEGYTEFLATVDIYVNTVLTTSVVADSAGYFTYTFGTALTAGDIVKTVVIDTALNSSTGLDTTVPYTNPSPASTGTAPTVTEFERTETLTFNFDGYIRSTVPVPVAEVNDPPTVVTIPNVYVPDVDYIQACYSYVDGGVTHVGYLTYAYGSNTITALEDLFNNTPSFGEFYPRLYAKLDGQVLADTLTTGTPEYTSNTQISRLLGLSWKEWSANLLSSIEQASEDFDVPDVTHVYQSLAVPMNTSDQLQLRYLFDYWFRMYSLVGVSVTSGIYANLNAKSGTVLEIRDSVYTHMVAYGAVSVNTVTGVIGDVGTYATAYYDRYDALAQLTPGTTGGLTYVPETQTSLTGTRSYAAAFHSYKHQINATQYVEVRVFDCKSIHLFANNSTTSLGNDEYLVIPLDRTIINEYALMDKEILCLKSLYVFVNIAKIVKIKWYQRSGMRFIGVVISVLIVAFTAGTGAPASAYIMAAIQALILTLVLELIIKLAVKAGVDPKVVAGIAAIALLIAGYAGTNGTEVFSLTAVELLQIANVGFAATAKLYSLDTQDIIKAKDLFNEEMQDKLEALKQAKAEIGNTVPLPFELLLSADRSKVFISLGETVESYMAKFNMNIIDTLQSYVSNYVDIMSEPPNIQAILAKQRGLSNDSL